MELQGQKYNVIGVSFSDGVGDTPEDEYRLLINPEINRMQGQFAARVFAH